MIKQLRELFKDESFREEVRRKLPTLFYAAELEVLRGGRVGMEVGTLREHILTALLIYKLGRENVGVTPITKHAADVQIFGEPLSIKTAKDSLRGVKAVWTVNAKRAKDFVDEYRPTCDILLAFVKWGKKGGLYHIPIEAQLDVFQQMGSNYLVLPKPGTNPRGVNFSSNALRELIMHFDTEQIAIDWIKPRLNLDPYDRWVKLWMEL